MDLHTRRIPNALTLSVAFLGMAFGALHVGGASVAGALGGLLVGLLLMLPGHVVGATGAGDVKLFAAVGALLGPAHIAAAFVYTALAGGALALVIAVLRRRLGVTLKQTATLVGTGGRNFAEIECASADNRFAYAPAIAIGTFIAVLGG